MRRAINRVVIRVVDSFDDVSLLANARVRKNHVGRGEIFQVRFERADVNRRPARNVFGQTDRRRDLLNVIEPRELTDAHAHRVARMDQAVRNRLDAAVSPVRISRRPISRAFDFARLDRPVANRRPRQKSVRKRECVNKRLERRTDLPVRRSQSAIEFTLRIIASADESADTAARIVDRYERALEVWHRRIFALLRRPIAGFRRMMKIRLVLDLGQLRFERLRRGGLDRRIERRVNEQAAVIDLILREEQIQIPLDRVHRIIFLDLK